VGLKHPKNTANKHTRVFLFCARFTDLQTQGSQEGPGIYVEKLTSKYEDAYSQFSFFQAKTTTLHTQTLPGY
jgi:hypothetical protein